MHRHKYRNTKQMNTYKMHICVLHTCALHTCAMLTCMLSMLVFCKILQSILTRVLHNWYCSLSVCCRTHHGGRVANYSEKIDFVEETHMAPGKREDKSGKSNKLSASLYWQGHRRGATMSIFLEKQKF